VLSWMLRAKLWLGGMVGLEKPCFSVSVPDGTKRSFRFPPGPF
jgi:hypothetical protein